MMDYQIADQLLAQSLWLVTRQGRPTAFACILLARCAGIPGCRHKYLLLDFVRTFGPHRCPWKSKPQGDLSMPGGIPIQRRGGTLPAHVSFPSLCLDEDGLLGGLRNMLQALKHQEGLCLKQSWGVQFSFLLQILQERPISGRKAHFSHPRRI